MPTDYLVTSTELEETADAIRAKTGGSALIEWEEGEGYKNAIAAIPSGGGGNPADKTVKFMDYDGTFLYEYTPEEFAALAALPALVSHTGKAAATAWNWTLADAKTYVSNYGHLIIGQEYDTLEFDIELLGNVLSPYFRMGVKGTAVISWGDGTSDTLTGTNNITMQYKQHTYSSPGEYTISVAAGTSSTTFGFYDSATNRTILSNGSNTLNDNYRYMSSLKHVRLNSITLLSQYSFAYAVSLNCISIPRAQTFIGKNTFDYCRSLRHISMPREVTSIGENSFRYCSLLEEFIIPDQVTTLGASNQYMARECESLELVIVPGSVTTLGNYLFYKAPHLKKVILGNGIPLIYSNMFYGCNTLEEITIPGSVTSIGGSAFISNYTLRNITFNEGLTTILSDAFSANYVLQSVVFPSTITSIGAQAFANNYALQSITVLATSPPTISSNTFNSSTPIFTIYVPYSADHSILTAYQNDTNWSAYSSKMVELPA